MHPRPSRFPDPHDAPADGPLAVGGDLEPATLLDAYAHGIFPWPLDRRLLTWWSPDPRGVIPLDGLHTSRTLRRTLRRGRFTTTADRAFAAVVAGCADRAATWITPALADAYATLHELGHAHSLEVWDARGDLVGGVYGVVLGGAFAGESMFHTAPDASKVALVALVERLRARGFALFDVQLLTPHLASLGAIALPREEFLELLSEALASPARW